jgi:hypothetical protein
MLSEFEVGVHRGNVHSPRLQEYQKKGKPLPKKNGCTSILQIVNERLEAAGLRPPRERKPPHRLRTPGGRKPRAAKDRYADSTSSPWAPLARVPYQRLRRRGKQLRRHTDQLTHGNRVSQARSSTCSGCSLHWVTTLSRAQHTPFYGLWVQG